jgi:hypothetical protein
MTDEHPWMSKDLLVRLRWWAFKFCGKGEQENLASDAMSEAVSRIEKLEAALDDVAGYLARADWYYLKPETRKALEGEDE